MPSETNLSETNLGEPNLGESEMKNYLFKILLLALLVSAVYAGVNEAQQSTAEPADKFVPTEKLRADEAVSFPVDI